MESSNPEKDDKHSKETSGDPNQPRKQKRRTRNDPNNRNFTCGCGKAYLSYPALYTHLKQKHDGKPPEGTNLPQSSSKGIRGRPKVNKEEPENHEKSEHENNSETSLDQENPLDELLYYLANLSKALTRDVDKAGSSLVLEAENEDMNIVSTFPAESFADTQDYLGILIYLKELIHNNGNFQEEFQEESHLKKTIARHVSPECFKELCVFICLFRKTLNAKGWEKKRQVTESREPEKTENDQKEKYEIPYSEVNTAEFALEISNDFIIENFPKYFKEIKAGEFKILGEDEEKLKNLVYLTQHFCNWLFSNYYTNSSEVYYKLLNINCKQKTKPKMGRGNIEFTDT